MTDTVDDNTDPDSGHGNPPPKDPPKTGSGARVAPIEPVQTTTPAPAPADKKAKK